MALIQTTHGELDESLLGKKTGFEEDTDKTLNWVEYWLKDELVHRSVDLHLKQGIDMSLDAASLV